MQNMNMIPHLYLCLSCQSCYCYKKTFFFLTAQCDLCNLLSHSAFWSRLLRCKMELSAANDLYRDGSTRTKRISQLTWISGVDQFHSHNKISGEDYAV